MIVELGCNKPQEGSLLMPYTQWSKALYKCIRASFVTTLLITWLFSCLIWSEKCLFELVSWAMYKHWILIVISNVISLYVPFFLSLLMRFNHTLLLYCGSRCCKWTQQTVGWMHILACTGTEALKTSDDCEKHVSRKSVSELQRNSLPASFFYCGWNKAVVMQCHDGRDTKGTVWANAIPIIWCTHTNNLVFVRE